MLENSKIVSFLSNFDFSLMQSTFLPGYLKLVENGSFENTMPLDHLLSHVSSPFLYKENREDVARCTLKIDKIEA